MKRIKIKKTSSAYNNLTEGVNLLSLTLGLTLSLAGCGAWNKDPVPQSEGVTLEDLRIYAKDQSKKAPEQPRVITQTIIVEKPKLVVKEESSIDSNFVVITPDSEMAFNEGQNAAYKVRARVLVPGLKVRLKAQGLPEGATLSPAKNEQDLYYINWTPALYTISANAEMKAYNVKLMAEIYSEDKSKDLTHLQGLAMTKEISLFLFKNQELPTELKVNDLPIEITEGQIVPFTVTVKVPGLDDKSPLKPRLVISFDGVSYTAGNNFLERDGSRHVVADPQHKSLEYLGDSKWKYSVLFDTKNISVQPQQAKDGSLLENADGTRVRLSFKVFNLFGLSTPETLYQMKIKKAQPADTVAASAVTKKTESKKESSKGDGTKKADSKTKDASSSGKNDSGQNDSDKNDSAQNDGAQNNNTAQNVNSEEGQKNENK